MASRHEYVLELIAEFAQVVKGAGYKVYLAEKKTYGYYTDEEGSRVISFQETYGMIDLSGNYITSAPKQTGTGWKIYDELSTGNKAFLEQKIHSAFNASPPPWAVGKGIEWRYATQKDHQDRYQSSSRYEEVT